MEGETPKSEASVNTGGDMKAGVRSMVDQLEAILDEYMVKKAPFALPLGLKEFLATISPYLIIVSAILLIPVLLLAFGVSSILAPYGMMGGYGYSWGVQGILSLVVTIVIFGLQLMAVPGLFKRTKSSWRLLFYVSIVQLFGSLVSPHIANALIGALIGALISWYILFQMKDMYKN